MTRSRSLRSPFLWLLLAVTLGIARASAQRGPMFQRPDSVATQSGTPRWAFWLQQSWAGAELIALMVAVYQLWARRNERRVVEAEQARLALKGADYQGGGGGKT